MDEPTPLAPRRRATDELDRRLNDLPMEPSPNAKPRRRQVDGWLDRWAATVEDLARLKGTHPMLDATIDEQEGRRIRIGDRWLTDWASCNYLGFDLDQEIIDAVPGYLAEWGTHPSWSRLLGNPRLYPEIEEQLAELVGAEDVLLLPTITHIHLSVIQVLVGDGTLFLDGRAHKTIYDGAMAAAGHGASVVRFRHDDPGHLEELLRTTEPAAPRVIAMDGVNSMTGNAPDLAEFSRIAQTYDCLLYVDDAHGFGVIGERSRDEPCSYGVKGNSVFRHQGVSYDGAVLVAGMSKAYSSLLAFMALPTRLKDALKVLAPPYLYSGPSPVASLATALVGLEVNRTRGDAIRADLARKTRRLLGAIYDLGIHTPNTSGYPIIEIPLATQDELDELGRYLFDHGQYATLAAYPLVPKNEVGFRIQVTASNTDEQIDELIGVLSSLHDHFQLEQVVEHMPPASGNWATASLGRPTASTLPLL